MIAVIDYGRGNLFSIGQALRHLDAEYEVTATLDGLERAERIILPGVGAFGDGMAALTSLGLVKPLQQAAARGVPILGICLGMQMLLERSEEFGDFQGLGLIPGLVSRLPGGPQRIPNVGWRVLDTVAGGLLADLKPRTMAYFVHSYAPRGLLSADVAATISFNAEDIPVVIRRGSVVGYQFHPEKSGLAGLGLIRRFLELA